MVHNGINEGIRRYFVIDRCPEDHFNNFINSQCGGINKTDVEDFLWVSDSTTGKIYQNYHCAVCHEVKDWVTWQLRTMCRSSLQFSFASLSEFPFNDRCNIINEAPETLAEVTARYQCYIPDISNCNVTGFWKHYNKDIEMGCQSFTQMYFETIEIYGVIKSYKNMFCYLCNTDDGTIVQDLCLVSNLPTRSKIPRFNVLINFKRKDSLLDNPLCPIDEYYDMYVVSVVLGIIWN